jgi:hypothetical protein
MNDDEPESRPGDLGPGPSVLDGGDLRRRLANLRVEHEDLDASVAALAAVSHPDQVRIARLKKKKLTLRDEITRLEDMLTPDIIA